MPLALAFQFVYVSLMNSFHQYSLFHPPKCKQESIVSIQAPTEDRPQVCNKGEIPIDRVEANRCDAG